MCREQEKTIAEIELIAIHDQTCRDDHRTCLALAENGLQASLIIFPALRQSVRQTGVAYEFRPVLLERSRTEYMIGVDVREHHETNRQLRHLANPCAQALAVVEASARIEHGHGVPAHDAADVGDRIAGGGAGILL